MIKSNLIRIFLLSIALSIYALGAGAQILKPAQWTFSVDPQKTSIGEEVILTLEAKIDDKWYLYSSDFDPELGPILTTLDIYSSSFEKVGPLKAIKPSKKYDDLWEGEVSFFKKKAVFTQRLKVLEANPDLSGEVNWQTCTDIDGRCINGSDKFSITISIATGQKSSTINTGLKKKVK